MGLIYGVYDAKTGGVASCQAASSLAAWTRPGHDRDGDTRLA